MAQVICVAELRLRARTLAILKVEVVASGLTIVAALPSVAQIQEAAIHNPYDRSHQGLAGAQEQWLSPRHNHWRSEPPPDAGGRNSLS